MLTMKKLLTSAAVLALLVNPVYSQNVSFEDICGEGGSFKIDNGDPYYDKFICSCRENGYVISYPDEQDESVDILECIHYKNKGLSGRDISLLTAGAIIFVTFMSINYPDRRYGLFALEDEKQEKNFDVEPFKDGFKIRYTIRY